MYRQKDMIGKIELTGIRIFAHHGCFEQEREIGNFFIVDMECLTDMSLPMLDDNLDSAVNYQKIYDLVKEEMAVPSRLLEHVAGRILLRLRKDFPEVVSAKVSVAKLNPPLGGEVASSRVTLSY